MNYYALFYDVVDGFVARWPRTERNIFGTRSKQIAVANSSLLARWPIRQMELCLCFALRRALSSKSLLGRIPMLGVDW